MPPRPGIFNGRDGYVGEAVEIIRRNLDGTRLAILGPGGMGKTSVALAIAHHIDIVQLFGDCRYWIHCTHATTVSLLVDQVAWSLGINRTSSYTIPDLLSHIHNAVTLSPKPRLLILDNFETPFYTEKASELTLFLQSLASMPQIALLLTMRGTKRPCPTIGWTTPFLLPLPPLLPDDARQTYLDICPSAKDSPCLDKLLGVLDGMPLAVTLMAEVGEDPQDLLDRWKTEGTSLLEQSNEPTNSVKKSIFISINSPPMKSKSEALPLLQILSMLPGGTARDRLPIIAPGLKLPFAALDTLRNISLAQVDEGQIRVLSPIRSYVLHHHLLPLDYRQHLFKAYYHLANRAQCIGTPEFVEAKLDLAREGANMDTILMEALKDVKDVDGHDPIRASERYSWYLCVHSPRIDVIQEAISAAERLECFDLLADCLYVKGCIQSNRGALAEAGDDFRRARKLYARVGNKKREAFSLEKLGQMCLSEGRHEEARSHLLEAKPIFEDIGHILGIGQCLRTLGEILRIEHRHEEARNHLEEAKVKFEEAQDSIGPARCLRSLGNVLIAEGNHEGARTPLRNSQAISERIGDSRGVIQCLHSLGRILIAEANYDEAESHLAMTKTQSEAVGFARGAVLCAESLKEIIGLRKPHSV